MFLLVLKLIFLRLLMDSRSQTALILIAKQMISIIRDLVIQSAQWYSNIYLFRKLVCAMHWLKMWSRWIWIIKGNFIRNWVNNNSGHLTVTVPFVDLKVKFPSPRTSSLKNCTSVVWSLSPWLLVNEANIMAKIQLIIISFFFP